MCLKLEPVSVRIREAEAIYLYHISYAILTEPRTHCAYCMISFKGAKEQKYVEDNVDIHEYSHM